jgi:hypothetical protein
MKKIIEITDTDERGYLRVDLRDLLRAVSSSGAGWRWVFTSLEAKGDVTPVWPAGMLDLEQAAARAGGVQLEWRDLVRLSEHLFQTIDCKLVATLPASDHVVLTIEAIDSSCWLIGSDDAQLLAIVASQFTNVREIV